MSQENTDFCKKKVFAQWERIELLSQRRFPSDSTTALGASRFVLERLAADDWRRVRAYNGTAQFTTYLTAVVLNLLEDYSRIIDPDPPKRPPEWLKHMGPLWVEVFRRLCRERMAPTDVVYSMTVGDATGRDPAFVREAIEVILARVPDCCSKRGETVSIEAGIKNNPARNELPDTAADTPEDCVTGLERSQIITRICSCLFAENTANDSARDESTSLKNALQVFRSNLKLSAGDRIFLKMVYQDGLNVAQAGKHLGWNNNQAQGKHRRLLEHIAGAFKASGLEQELKQMIL